MKSEKIFVLFLLYIACCFEHAKSYSIGTYPGINIPVSRRDPDIAFGEEAVMGSKKFDRASAFHLPVGFSVAKKEHIFTAGAKNTRNMFLYAFDNSDGLLFRWTINRYDGTLYDHRKYDAPYEEVSFDKYNNVMVVSSQSGSRISIVPFNDYGVPIKEVTEHYDASGNLVASGNYFKSFLGEYLTYKDRSFLAVVIKYNFTYPSFAQWGFVEADPTAMIDLYTDTEFEHFYEHAPSLTNKHVFVFGRNGTSDTNTINFGAFTVASGAASYANSYSNANILGLISLEARKDESATAPNELLAVTDTKLVFLDAAASAITVHDTLTWNPYTEAVARGDATTNIKCKGGLFINGTGTDPAVVVCQENNKGYIIRVDSNSTKAYASDVLFLSGVVFTEAMTSDVRGNFVFMYASECGTNSANVKVPCIVTAVLDEIRYETERENGIRIVLQLVAIFGTGAMFVMPFVMWVSSFIKYKAIFKGDKKKNPTWKAFKNTFTDAVYLILEAPFFIVFLSLYGMYGADSEDFDF